MAWTIDASHSTVGFSVRHMMISKVRGRFNDFSGTIEFDEQQPANSSVNVSVNVDSIETRDERRDGHLKSADFFDVASHPTMTFVSRKVEAIDANHGRITGDLTIRGISREVVLETEFNGKSKSPWGTVSAGFSAHAVINRKDFGLEWNAPLETGGVLVGEEVTIEIEVEIVQG
jgi:polyisoprenoid-binding protein YceI